MDKITLYKDTARGLNDLVTDTVPTAATATTLDVSSFIQDTPRRLVGKSVYIYSGAGIGQERTTGSFNPSAKRIIFPEAFATVPSINSNFLMFDYFTKPDYDAAFDQMFRKARSRYLQERSATLSLVATQWAYAVPSGFKTITEIRLVPSTNTDYEASDYVDRIYRFNHKYDYHLERNPLGTYMIIFDPRALTLDLLDKHWCHVVGQAEPDTVGSDGATVPRDLEDYLINGMQMMLAARRIDENKQWQAKFFIYRDEDRKLEEYIFRHRRGKPVE